MQIWKNLNKKNNFRILINNKHHKFKTQIIKTSKIKIKLFNKIRCINKWLKV